MLLFMGSMALSSLVMIRTSPSGAGNQQYILLGVFALMGVFFVPTFPAGLSLYWITTNFWTVGQQYAAAKLIPAPARRRRRRRRRRRNRRHRRPESAKSAASGACAAARITLRP